MEETIKLPKLALKMQEGKIVRWLKQEGELVAEGEPLAEISTGKVNVQMEAPLSGKIISLLLAAGSKAPVGADIAVIKNMPVCVGQGVALPVYDPALASERFDVVVIGGGPGGYVAAIRAAQMGGRIALVEKNQLGGTCLNRGCIPTKTLVKSAELFALCKKAAEFGINIPEPQVKWEQIIARKDAVVEQLRSGIEQLLQANNVAVVQGVGSIAGQGQVKVSNECDEIILQTKNIIIATGSRPARLPIPGADLNGVLTSDDILSLDQLPKSLTIIGGGVIGIEFAWIFSTLGVKVTIIEMLPRILMPVDEEIALQLHDILTQQGVAIYTQTGVSSIRTVEGNGLIVTALDAKGTEKIFFSEKVLIATGRLYESTGLNIEWAALTARSAIKTDAGMRTELPGVYAIGDVTGNMLLAHVASSQAMVAADNAMGHEREINYRVIPSAIFTCPEIGSVGLTEEQAIQQGYDVKVSRFPFAAIGKALAMGETEGQLKLICEKNTGEILGSHIIGPHATDLIAVLAVSMQNGLTAEQVAHTVFAHPTAAEVIMEAAHGISGKAIHLP